MIANETFDGLAFPVAKVRYIGGAYTASVYRDRERTYRVKVSYDAATGGGARGALPAALKAFDKALKDNNGLERDGDYVAIPGDLNGDEYAFTFVPKHFFER